MKILDFQRHTVNIRIYQPYPPEKTTIKKAFNIRRIFMERLGNIPIFNIPGTLFGNTPRNVNGNFFRTFREYIIMAMFHEYSTNIYLPVGIRLLQSSRCSVAYLNFRCICKVYQEVGNVIQ